jgi:uncharacterized membrane protein YhiD involved in acid resistance
VKAKKWILIIVLIVIIALKKVVELLQKKAIAQKRAIQTINETNLLLTAQILQKAPISTTTQQNNNNTIQQDVNYTQVFLNAYNT